MHWGGLRGRWSLQGQVKIIARSSQEKRGRREPHHVAHHRVCRDAQCNRRKWQLHLIAHQGRNDAQGCHLLLVGLAVLSNLRRKCAETSKERGLVDADLRVTRE